MPSMYVFFAPGPVELLIFAVMAGFPLATIFVVLWLLRREVRPDGRVEGDPWGPRPTGGGVTREQPVDAEVLEDSEPRQP